MTVAIYARVSSDSQEARGTIGSQLDFCVRRWRGSGIRSSTSAPTMVTPEHAWTGGLDALRDASKRASSEQVWCTDARPASAQLLRPDPDHRRVGQAWRPDPLPRRSRGPRQSRGHAVGSGVQGVIARV